jgi:catechol 2,3-dioxygenase-like lactoylglutathione lyase family enzyme
MGPELLGTNGDTMAKLRHVAVKVDDLEEAAKFYSEVFELEELSRGGDFVESGYVYLTDGTINIALLKMPTHRVLANSKPDGLNHIGFVVDDMDAAVDRAVRFGAEPLDMAGDNEQAKKVGTVSPELKFRTPDGVAFDFSMDWPGISAVD